LRPHKICEILEHAGREARSDERRQSSSDSLRQMHPKSLEGHV